MELIQIFLKELELEAATTRKMLERVPNDKFGWQPHPKSMTIQRLATHIAELPSWVAMTLTTDELDFEKNEYKPREITSAQGLLDYLEENLASAREHLQKAKPEELEKNWTLRSGATV